MVGSRQRFLMMSGAGAASAAVPRAALGQGRNLVRMADVLSDSFGQPLFVKDAGAFARRGFDVEVSNMNNVGAVLAAMSGGSLEMGVADLILGVKAMLSGAPVIMLAGSGLYLANEPTAVLAVTPSSPIRVAKDLVGKTIAVPTLGALTASSLLAWLPQNGVEASAVKLVEVPQPAVVPALERGTIDCGLLGEPFITGGKGRIRDIGHPYDAIAKEFPISVWYAAKSWVDANPARARDAVASIYDTARWANTHRTETFQILVRDAHFDADALKGMIRTTFATNLQPAQAQPVLDFATKYKIFDRQVEASTMIAKL
jgi:NitT/TauT family transport system substrate-binding protein